MSHLKIRLIKIGRRLCFLIIAFLLMGGTPSHAEAQLHIFFPLLRKVQNVRISNVKVIQGISESASYLVAIADRMAEVRVFLAVDGGGSLSQVNASLCGYDSAGKELSCIKPRNGPVTAPSREEDLSSTLNFDLPAGWLKAGYSYAVELQPGADGDRSDNRYPKTGTLPFNFNPAEAIQVMVVPVKYKPYQDKNSYLPELGDTSYLTSLPIKVFPVAAVDYEYHATFTYAPGDSAQNLDNNTGEGWLELLSEITQLHVTEGGNQNYYGLVNSYSAHGCEGGCITGIGWIPDPGDPQNSAYQTAVGWSGEGAGTSLAGETIIHELGHNFNRLHVKCEGSESQPDPSYPYAGGSIGQYGLDIASDQLYAPGEYADYMSYCKQTWTSDYTYWNIYQYRKAHPLASFAPAPAVDTLYIGGWIDPAGEVTLRPVYRQDASPDPETGGDYQIELLAADGRILESRVFTPAAIPDVPGYRSFSLVVPAVDGLSGIRIRDGGQAIFEKLATASAAAPNFEAAQITITTSPGGAVASWTAASSSESRLFYRVRLSQDGGLTWQVLALDWTATSIQLPEIAGVNSDAVRLEIQASDGIRTSSAVYSPDN